MSAGGKKFGLCFDASDVVFKALVMALDDVDEVFFHLLDVFVFDEVGDDFGGFFKEAFDISEDHALCDEWGF